MSDEPKNSLLRDYDAADVERVKSILMRYGEFGSTQEYAQKQATICAHEILAMLTPEAALQSDA